ncbi:hypothetical protein L3i20_v237180 [Paenibacillus sp. L3-i20]|nr:hypothetical protein L3i20_v237180 [Paenibacillus sp. L3-i20]
MGRHNIYISLKRTSPENRQRFISNAPGRVVGTIDKRFGGIAWVVSPHRSDQNTGAECVGVFGPTAQRMLHEMSIRKGSRHEQAKSKGI